MPSGPSGETDILPLLSDVEDDVDLGVYGERQHDQVGEAGAASIDKEGPW